MTPLPKKKHTRARSNKRRGGQMARTNGLPNMSPCKSCGKPKFSHAACPHCGAY